MLKKLLEQKPKTVAELTRDAVFVHVRGETETLVKVANTPTPTTLRGHEMQVTILQVGQNGSPKGILFGFKSKGYRTMQDYVNKLEIAWSYNNYLRYPRKGLAKWLFGV